MSAYDKTHAHFKAMIVSSAGVCEDMCGLTHDEVCQSMCKLLAEKRIEPIAEVAGLYRYHARADIAQAPEEQKRLLWAMNMPHNWPETFTVFSVAQLAGVTEEYARHYCSSLLRDKYIRATTATAKKRHSKDRKYRVCEGAPSANAPPVVKFYSRIRRKANG